MPDNLRIELDISAGSEAGHFPRQIFIGGLHHLSQALDTRLNPLRCRQQFISGLCRLRVNIGDTIRGLLLHRIGQRGVDLRQRLLQAIFGSLYLRIQCGIAVGQRFADPGNFQVDGGVDFRSRIGD